MVTTKKQHFVVIPDLIRNLYRSCIIILYFLIFSFGQLLRFETHILNIPFALHPLDIITLLSIPYGVFIQEKAHPLRKYFYYLWSVFFFSLLVSKAQYPIGEVVRGSFYLLRFISYYFFFELIYYLIQNGELGKQKIVTIIITSLITTGVFGWIQYLFVPDLRFLYFFHWDDHLNRLAGTILDPGFMGILMVFGFLISVSLYLKHKKISFILSSFFFIITTLFTYSRATYLALIAGVFTLLYLHKKTKLIFIISVVFIASLFLLPKKEGEGVNLLRTNSIFEKAKNYEETSSIISDVPVFGVGFNNLCSERKVRFVNQDFESHSCSGSDSSILFIFATTGILGLVTLVSFFSRIPDYISQSIYSEMLLSSSVALFIHSLFLNSLFYPWVLGVMATLLALSVKEST